MNTRAHLARRIVAPAVVVLLACPLAGTAVGAEGGPAVDDPTRSTAAGVYLVTLTGRGTAEHPSTRPAPGHRFDRSRPAVTRLAATLRQRQDRLLHRVGDPPVLYRYTTVLDGFAARLDEDQVKQLRADPSVSLVERSAVRRTAGDAPEGSADARGAVGARAGARSLVGGPGRAGRGVVVGVVDSGIWPENPSFAGLPQQQPGRSAALPGFHGTCGAAQRWSPDDCNDKVVSARWFVAGFGRDRLASTEMLSARDSTGHGSHAASVAAGERGVEVRIDGEGFGRHGGTAPGARLAVYKACWTAPDPAHDGCATADVVAAVDRAVADGVDVLSYSVGGSSDPADTVSRAFLGAASAGVFVAAAAGNADSAEANAGGTAAQRPVANVAPWVTTVGATALHRFRGAVLLGDGAELTGAMASDDPVPSAPLVSARDAAAAGASRRAATLCEAGALDPEAVRGAIVVCQRGVVPRLDKSDTVARAGGAGMVLVNTGEATLEADVHAVPTVHLDRADGAVLADYLRSAGQDASASLDPRPTDESSRPTVAGFSAHGPVPGQDLLKPDLLAPGVAVLGAVAPVAGSGRLWDLRSGTSVSAPHVAGLAALLRSRHPRWSPARLSSAMVTTADPLTGPARPLAEGAGQVDARRMLDPGLVLDERPSAWRAFLDGERGGARLNTPSIAVQRLVGRTTVVRRLTNVTGTRETYTVSVTGLRGVDVDVRPRSITLRAGQTRTVRVRLAATAATPVDGYATGALTWTGPRHEARVPVAVRAAAVKAPEEIGSSLGAAGSGRVVVRGRSGTGRQVRVTGVALAGTYPIGVSLRPGHLDPASPANDADTLSTTVAVPAAARAARFEVSGSNAGDDLDLYVYRAGRLVAESAGPGADATVTLADPEPGDYTVTVHAAAAGNGAASTGELTTWVVGPGPTPAASVDTRQGGRGPRAPFRATVRWKGLDPTQRWFGVVDYAGSDARTYLRLG